MVQETEGVPGPCVDPARAKRVYGGKKGSRTAAITIVLALTK
ncbi:hypothetical protein GCM10010116_46400 [Microbispora rosea subsp. aerata]|nr:hypothetical protein GCM10010116_46400 [Microbispora rosea subsp. aerata]